jgi:mono/diheme cytochrome c family protein
MRWAKYLFGFLIAALAIAACDLETRNTPIKPAMTRTAAEPPPAGVDPAAYRGAAIAQQVCNQCHDIGLGKGALVDVGAPAFRSIAGRPETNPQGLAAWMRASHAVMPNYMFEGPDVADLAAFIVSLR